MCICAYYLRKFYVTYIKPFRDLVAEMQAGKNGEQQDEMAAFMKVLGSGADGNSLNGPDFGKMMTEQLALQEQNKGSMTDPTSLSELQMMKALLGGADSAGGGATDTLLQNSEISKGKYMTEVEVAFHAKQKLSDDTVSRNLHLMKDEMNQCWTRVQSISAKLKGIEISASPAETPQHSPQKNKVKTPAEIQRGVLFHELQACCLAKLIASMVSLELLLLSHRVMVYNFSVADAR